MQTVLYLDVDPAVLADLLSTLTMQCEVLAIRAGQEVLPSGSGGGNDDEAAMRALLTAHGLTPRQCDLVVLDVQGHSRADIAELCGISTVTVKKYWAAIYRRLQVESRPMLRAWLVAHLGSTPLPERSMPASQKPAF
jgi:DNA-binding NarL/FixJ family response regulator